MARRKSKYLQEDLTKDKYIDFDEVPGPVALQVKKCAALYKRRRKLENDLDGTLQKYKEDSTDVITYLRQNELSGIRDFVQGNQHSLVFLKETTGTPSFKAVVAAALEAKTITRKTAAQLQKTYEFLLSEKVASTSLVIRIQE